MGQNLVTTVVLSLQLLAFELTDQITSIPHIANNHRDVRLNRGAMGALILLLYT
jgi:hypothetical protein